MQDRTTVTLGLPEALTTKWRAASERFEVADARLQKAIRGGGTVEPLATERDSADMRMHDVRFEMAMHVAAELQVPFEDVVESQVEFGGRALRVTHVSRQWGP